MLDMSEHEISGAPSDARQHYYNLVEGVISRLLKQKNLPASLLTPETAIASLDLDSLNIAEMLVDFELSLEIEIGAADMAGVTNLSDLVGLLQRLHASVNV